MPLLPDHVPGGVEQPADPSPAQGITDITLSRAQSHAAQRSADGAMPLHWRWAPPGGAPGPQPGARLQRDPGQDGLDVVGGRLDDGRGQHVEHDLVGDEIAAGLLGRDLAAQRTGSRGLRPQQITRGDVPHTEPGCQPLALGAFAGARGASSSSLTGR